MNGYGWMSSFLHNTNAALVDICAIYFHLGFFEVNWMSSVLSFPDFKSIGKMPCLRPFSLVSFETLEHRGGDFC